MLGDDLSAFFAADEFAVTARWEPVAGGTEEQLVIFDRPDALLLEGSVQSREYQIVYPASCFVGMAAGDAIVIGAISYAVLGEPDAIEDGALMRARLYNR